MTQRRSAADDDRPEGGGPSPRRNGDRRIREDAIAASDNCLLTPAPAPPRTPTIALDIRADRRREAAPEEGVDFPALPAWMSDRPYLTGAHLGRGATSETKSTATRTPSRETPWTRTPPRPSSWCSTTCCTRCSARRGGTFGRGGRRGAGEPIGARDSSMVASSVAEYIGSAGDPEGPTAANRRRRRSREPPRFAVEPGLETSSRLSWRTYSAVLPRAQVADYVETR